MKNLVGLYIW